MARSEAAWLQDLLLELGARSDILSLRALRAELDATREMVPLDIATDPTDSVSPSAK